MDAARPDRRADGGRDGDGRDLGLPGFRRRLLHAALREGAAASLAENHPDRPLYGALLETSPAPSAAPRFRSWRSPSASGLFSPGKPIGCGGGSFPERADLSWIAATMAFAPLLVSMQFTTVTTLFPVNLPVTPRPRGPALASAWGGRRGAAGLVPRRLSHGRRRPGLGIRRGGRRRECGAASGPSPLALRRRGRARRRRRLCGVSPLRRHRQPAETGCRRPDRRIRRPPLERAVAVALGTLVHPPRRLRPGGLGDPLRRRLPSTWIAVFAGALIALGAALTASLRARRAAAAGPPLRRPPSGRGRGSRASSFCPAAPR